VCAVANAAAFARSASEAGSLAWNVRCDGAGGRPVTGEGAERRAHATGLVVPGSSLEVQPDTMA